MASLKVKVSAEDHVRGAAGAKVTLVEYGDFQCPHCAMAHAVVAKLERHFGERLRFVSRNFPLTEIHPLAEPAAEVAEFAGSKGKYWEMYDAIFAHQKSLSVAMLKKTAESLGLDGKEAGAAIEDGEFTKKIEGDLRGGEQSGVHGTPTFFINGEQYEGAWDYDELVAAIDEVM